MTNTDEPLFDSAGDSAIEPSGDPSELQTLIRRLVETQPYAVLCMQSQSQPYGALVAFAFSADLKHAVLATPIATRKYRILSQCRQVALVIDDRPDHPDNFMAVEAVTATGRATLLERESDLEAWEGLLVRRHPYLEDFIAAPSSAVFRIDIVRFFHVARFQEVRQWIP